MELERETEVESRSPHDSAAGSWIRRFLTALVLAALVSPAVRNHDSLPLSTYPMFSSARSNVSSFVTAVGVDADGGQTTLSALTISGSRDRLIAQAFLNDAVQRGDAALVCADIARRLEAPVVTVEIAIERHDTVGRVQGADSLQTRELLASCGVPG